MITDEIRMAIEAIITGGMEGALDADDDMVKLVRAWLLKPYVIANGENTPPREPGDYWFKGIIGHEADGYDAGYADIVTLDDQGNVWLAGSGQEGWIPIGDVYGRWWGPIVPPWKD